MLQRPICYVCCSHPAPEWRWVGGAVETRLRHHLTGPTTQRAPAADGGGDAVFLQMRGEPIMVMTVQAPPADMADDAAQRAAWPGCQEASRTWRSHFVVSAMDAADHLADRRAAVENTMRVAATLVGVAKGDAIGWGPSGLFHPAADFAERVAHNPLHPDNLVRCDWSVGSDTGALGAQTRGLSAFGLPELSHVSSEEDRRTIQTRLVSLAAYVIAHGPVFRPGETVGADARTQARVETGQDLNGAPLLIVTPEFRTVSRAA